MKSPGLRKALAEARESKAARAKRELIAKNPRLGWREKDTSIRKVLVSKLQTSRAKIAESVGVHPRKLLRIEHDLITKMQKGKIIFITDIKKSHELAEYKDKINKLFESSSQKDIIDMHKKEIEKYVEDVAWIIDGLMRVRNNIQAEHNGHDKR